MQHHWSDFAAQFETSSYTSRARIIATCYSNEYFISGQVVKFRPPQFSTSLGTVLNSILLGKSSEF